ncbi:glycosyltransferase family 4 protein [Pedobacter agri]|uniref:glycosyltransferase family 4 protein n=1 Tax=Pedobacter agri TaxID=454586 RepID=UPI00293010DC|nr:glycosyltransferase family 4 protein [Pedobacter agri]
MKILFITNMFPVEDYQSFGIHVKEQIESLKNVESDIFFINGRESKVNYFKSIRSIKHALKSKDYDLIHIHYAISGLFLLFFRPKVPVIITLHGGELFGMKGFINRFLQKNITLNILKYASKVIVLNDLTAELLKSHQNKLMKIPCGINANRFKQLAGPEETDTLKIGFPSSRSRIEKNWPLFTSIIEELKARFNIVVVEFDDMTRDEVAQNLNELDLLIMTSFSEGSPQIIKEAMGCNKPIVSTNVGDVSDLLQDVRNCFVVETFDKMDFIAPVEAILLLNKEDRVSNGRQKLMQMGIDEGSVAEKLSKMYESVI